MPLAVQQHGRGRSCPVSRPRRGRGARHGEGSGRLPRAARAGGGGEPAGKGRVNIPAQGVLNTVCRPCRARGSSRGASSVGMGVWEAGLCRSSWDLPDFLRWMKSSILASTVSAPGCQDPRKVAHKQHICWPGAPAVSDSKLNWSSFEQTPVFLCLRRLDSVRHSPLKQVFFSPHI